MTTSDLESPPRRNPLVGLVEGVGSAVLGVFQTVGGVVALGVSVVAWTVRPPFRRAEPLRPVRLRRGRVDRPGRADRHLLRDGVRHPVLERLRAVRRREPGRPHGGPDRHPRAGPGVQRPDGDHARLLGHVHRAGDDAGDRAGGRPGDHGGQPGPVPPGPPGAGRAVHGAAAHHDLRHRGPERRVLRRRAAEGPVGRHLRAADPEPPGARRTSGRGWPRGRSSASR